MKTLFMKFKILAIAFFFGTVCVNEVYSQLALSVGFVSVTADYSSASFQKIQVTVLKTDGINAAQFIYYRADDNSGVYEEIRRSTSNTITDMDVETSKRAYCYKVSYIDFSGQVSPMSEPFCTVYLSGEGGNSIKWTPFSKLPNAAPVDYYIDIVDEASNGTINTVTPFTTRGLFANIYDIDGVEEQIDNFDKAIIRVRGTQLTTIPLGTITLTDFPITVYSNLYTIIPPLVVHVPTAFTPDGDTKNDKFLAQTRRVTNIVEFRMLIYDRWGNTVFESTDINNGWDGMQPDQVTPSLPGNYAYKITAKDIYDKTFEKMGSLLLIK